MWSYIWWWKMTLSKKEIENMKKNMKKVPIIQLKSDIYHKSEEVNAEKIINKVVEKIPENEPGNLPAGRQGTWEWKKINNVMSWNNKETRINNVINRFKKIFKF